MIEKFGNGIFGPSNTKTLQQPLLLLVVAKYDLEEYKMQTITHITLTVDFIPIYLLFSCMGNIKPSNV